MVVEAGVFSFLGFGVIVGLVSGLGMKFGSEEVFGAGYNVLPIWKKRLDAKTLVTTPNSDVIYAMSDVDRGQDGPLVFEAPPMLQGILLD